MLPVVFALGMVGAFLAWSLLAWCPPGTSVRHPDGGEYQLLAVTTGSTSVEYESSAYRFLRRILPPRFALKLPSPLQLSGLANEDGRQSVWVFLRRTKGNGRIHHLAPLDAEGFRMPGYSAALELQDAAGNSLTGYRLDSVPRRLKQFRLALFHREFSEFGQLTIDNPLFGDFPEWVPEPLPATHTNGPVAFTLSGYTIHAVHWIEHVIPEGQVASSDPAWAQARPDAHPHLIRDATGNSAGALALARTERAWRLEVALHRTRIEDFAPEERVDLKDLPLPEAGQVIRLNTRAQIHGVQLDFISLSGPGAVFIRNPYVHPESGDPALGTPEVAVAGPSQDSIARAGEEPVLSPWRLERSQPGSSGWPTTERGVDWAGRSWQTFKTSEGVHQRWECGRPLLLIRAVGMAAGDALLVRIQTRDGRLLAPVFPPAPSLPEGNAVRIYPVDVDARPEEAPLSVTVAMSQPRAFDFLISPRDAKVDSTNHEPTRVP